MSREDIVLRCIDKHGVGIEIGPSHNPVAPKKNGYKVHIIDHMGREQLIAKYTGHPVNLENIEEVDYVWQGESYSELTGKSKYYDWIIGSHVIEHAPDLIGFLNDCDTVLKDEGVLCLVIPDKRYCFDHFRPITGLSKVIDSHHAKNKIHSAGTVAEYFLNVVSKAGGITWDSTVLGDYKFVHGMTDAVQGMASVVKNASYIDVHAWCFVPHSFRLLIHDLYSLGFIHLREVDFSPTSGCEFYVTLSRKGRGPDKTRLEMLEIVESELSLSAGFPAVAEGAAPPEKSVRENGFFDRAMRRFRNQ